MPAIQYPTFRRKGGPTPADSLYVCEACGHAEWHYAVVHGPLVCSGDHGDGKKRRMRKATTKEQAAGEAAIRTEL